MRISDWSSDVCSSDLAALEAAQVQYTLYQPAGTQHGFNNDTTPRYDEDAAAEAWKRTLALFDRRLRGRQDDGKPRSPTHAAHSGSIRTRRPAPGGKTPAVRPEQARRRKQTPLRPPRSPGTSRRQIGRSPGRERLEQS